MMQVITVVNGFSTEGGGTGRLLSSDESSFKVVLPGQRPLFQEQQRFQLIINI